MKFHDITRANFRRSGTARDFEGVGEIIPAIGGAAAEELYLACCRVILNHGYLFYLINSMLQACWHYASFPGSPESHHSPAVGDAINVEGQGTRRREPRLSIRKGDSF
jgi:hypothetical protein